MKIQNENRNSQLKQLEGFYVNDIYWPIKKRTTQVLVNPSHKRMGLLVMHMYGLTCWSTIKSRCSNDS